MFSENKLFFESHSMMKWLCHMFLAQLSHSFLGINNSNYYDYYFKMM